MAITKVVLMPSCFCHLFIGNCKYIVTFTRWDRSLMLKVTLPVGGATEGSAPMTYMEKRGS